MNTRTIIVIAVLLVLGVGLFGVFYGTLGSQGGTNGGQVTSPWTEFTAQASVESHEGSFQFNYLFNVYSKMTFNGLDLVGWDLQAQVDYPDAENRTFRHVYYNGNAFFGETTNGSFTVTECTAVNQNNILDTGKNTFVPQQVSPDGRSSNFSIMCSSSNGQPCTQWRISIGNETFNMWVDAVSNIPKVLVSREQTIYVTSFNFGKTWSPVFVPAWQSVCPSDPNATDPSISVVTPPAGQNPNASADGSGSFNITAHETGGAVTYSSLTAPAFMRFLRSFEQRAADSAGSLQGAEDPSRLVLDEQQTAFFARYQSYVQKEAEWNQKQRMQSYLTRVPVDLTPLRNVDASIAAHKAYLMKEAADLRAKHGTQDVERGLYHELQEAKANGSSLITLNFNRNQKQDTVNVNADVNAVTTQGAYQGYCISSWAGDGWCDSINNNNVCGWDAGDCCPGTCRVSTYACGIVGWECPPPATEKPCLFLHGLGRKGPNTFTSEGGQMPDGYSYFSSNSGNKYWGNMESVLGGVCSSYDYGFFETTDNGWDVPTLQQRYYYKALEIQNRRGVIFGHSMANAILSGACLMQGLCLVRWYGIGSPARGSNAAKTQKLLSDVFRRSLAQGDISMSSDYKYLQGDPNREQLAYSHATGRLMNGLMCGVDSWGNGGVSGAALLAVTCVAYQCTVCTGYLPWWLGGFCSSWGAFPGDGCVSFDECGLYGWYDNGWKYARVSAPQGGDFNTDPSNKWYMAPGNHYDITGNTGVADIASWYRNMALRPT